MALQVQFELTNQGTNDYLWKTEAKGPYIGVTFGGSVYRNFGLQNKITTASEGYSQMYTAPIWQPESLSYFLPICANKNQGDLFATI